MQFWAAHWKPFAFQFLPQTFHTAVSFTMHQKGHPRLAGRLMPIQQLLLIRMRRETINRVDLGIDGHVLTLKANGLGPVDDVTRQGAKRGEADKYNAAFFAPDILLHVVSHPAPGTHA